MITVTHPADTISSKGNRTFECADDEALNREQYHRNNDGSNSNDVPVAKFDDGLNL